MGRSAERVASDYLSSMGDWRFEAPLPPCDPVVHALRQELVAHNGLPGLELLHPSTPGYVQKAVALLRRDGFCVVRDGFLQQLPALRAASDRVAADIMSKDPEGYGNRGPQRYSFGVASLTGQCLHEEEWAACVDLPAISPILGTIWPGGYKCDGGGGDFSSAHCTGYQPLHTDYRDALRLPVGGGLPIPLEAPTEPGREYKQMGGFWDPSGRVNYRDLPTPEITLNFLVQDFTALNGPTRQIPGTHTSQALIPTLEEEPPWMRLSTVLAPAGSVLIRDPRAWHGGTPNLTDDIRAIPNIEFSASWWGSPPMRKTMPRDIYETLSPHGQLLCAAIVAARDEAIETGYVGPWDKRGRGDNPANSLKLDGKPVVPRL